MQLEDLSLSRQDLLKIKSCLKDFLHKNPDVLVVELVQLNDVCALDLVEVRLFIEEKVGIDFDIITVRQALENWDSVFGG